MHKGVYRKAKKRFSLLLLEEGEEYEGDWVGFLTPPEEYKYLKHTRGSNQAAVKGRIRLCSTSVVFDPDDIRVPILKFPFKDVQQLDPQTDPDGFTIATKTVISMKENGLDAPYGYMKEKDTLLWRFELAYAGLEYLLKPLHEALCLAKMSFSERREAMKLIIDQKLRNLPQFDVAHLRDALNEVVQLKVPAIHIAPLVSEPGHLVLTNQALYFQPLHDIGGDKPVRIHPLKLILGVAKRKDRQREVAVEVFFHESDTSSNTKWDAPTALFAFQQQDECCSTYSKIAENSEIGKDTPIANKGAKLVCALLSGDERYIELVVKAWQKGLVSNFEYVLFLNLAAGRSFNDLSQWPVAPWILKDYASQTLDLKSPSVYRDLSKPVGALNTERLAMLKERFSLMPSDDPENPPFLYGTHYSNPGYVMYWLVRAAPGHLLRLQSGRFDAPDRMFYSINESWSSVQNNPADVKELIPEFFMTDAVKFLSSNDALPLGSRQNGQSIDAVQLPPWASSPAEFIRTHQAAMESEYVSKHLHHWIDLIFGYKQRGEEAVKADNVFHHLTYGTVDLDSIKDQMHRTAIEAQIQEFGQCPRQLFCSPHPVKDEVGPGDLSDEEVEPTSSCLLSVVNATLQWFDDTHLEAIAKTRNTRSSLPLMASSLNETLDFLDDNEVQDASVLNLNVKHQDNFEDSGAEAVPIDDLLLANGEKDDGENWDIDPHSCKLKHKIKAHSNAILSVAYSSDDFGTMIHCSTSDGILKAYSGDGKIVRSSSICTLPLSKIIVGQNKALKSKMGLHSFLSSYDGKLYCYKYDSGSTLGYIDAHNDAISSLVTPLEDASKIISASWDCTLKVWDLEKCNWYGSKPGNIFLHYRYLSI